MREVEWEADGKSIPMAQYIGQLLQFTWWCHSMKLFWKFTWLHCTYQKNLISIANIIDVGYWLKCIECTCTTAHCNLCIRVFRLHLNVNRMLYLFLNKTYDAFVIIKSYDSKLPSVLRTVLHRYTGTLCRTNNNK